MRRCGLRGVWFPPESLVTQGLDWIHPRGPQGGIESKDNADCYGNAEGKWDGPGNDLRSYVLNDWRKTAHLLRNGTNQDTTQPVHHPRACQAYQNSGYSSNGRKHDRLCEKLLHDIGLLGPQCTPNANFTRAFRYGRQ